MESVNMRNKMLQIRRKLMLGKYSENIEQFLKLLEPAKTILNVACGDGSLLKRSRK